MLGRLLTTIRKKYHPFHRLKKNKFFSKFILPLLDRPIYVRLHGVAWPVRVRLMRHLSYVLDNRSVEPGIAALFLAIIKLYRPKVFWDVGAHVGFYSWLVLSRNAQACAVLFEPDPENVRLLSQTIARSGLDRAEIVPCAVSDREEEAPFLVDSLSGATGTLLVDDPSFIARQYGLHQRRILVRTVALDGVIGTLPSPELIKIDVEGAEERVFAGGWNTIRRFRPILVFESPGAAASALVASLEGEGYFVCAADEPGAPPEEAENFLGLPPHLRERHSELLALWRAELEAWLGPARRRSRGEQASTRRR